MKKKTYINVTPMEFGIKWNMVFQSFNIEFLPILVKKQIFFIKTLSYILSPSYCIYYIKNKVTTTFDIVINIKRVPYKPNMKFPLNRINHINDS